MPRRAPRCIAYFDDSGDLALPDEALIEKVADSDVTFMGQSGGTLPTHSISHRHRRSISRQLDRWKVPCANRTLAVLESRVNDPFPFSNVAETKYGCITFASHVDNRNCRPIFGWPWNVPRFSPMPHRQPRIAFVQANKFSSLQGEMYSLRRQIVRESLRALLPLDIYGGNWGNSMLQNISSAITSDLFRLFQSVTCRTYLRGSRNRYSALDTRRLGTITRIENKFEMLSKYRYSLVIENDLEYVSEKIRDSLGCGCITFYLGPQSQILDDLPGLVRLPVIVKDAVEVVSHHLASRLDTFPDFDEIRSAAIARFPHPYTQMWIRLGEVWLDTYGGSR